MYNINLYVSFDWESCLGLFPTSTKIHRHLNSSSCHSEGCLFLWFNLFFKLFFTWKNIKLTFFKYFFKKFDVLILKIKKKYMKKTSFWCIFNYKSDMNPVEIKIQEPTVKLTLHEKIKFILVTGFDTTITCTETPRL